MILPLQISYIGVTLPRSGLHTKPAGPPKFLRSTARIKGEGNLDSPWTNLSEPPDCRFGNQHVYSL